MARDLVDRIDPHSPRYAARWAELLDRVEITDLTRVDIRLNRAPLRAGQWFLGPVGPAHASIDGRVATAGRDRPLVSDGAYQCFMANGEQVGRVATLALASRPSVDFCGYWQRHKEA